MTPQNTQGISDQFQRTLIIIVQHVAMNVSVDKTLIGKDECNLPKLIPLLNNFKLQYETLIGINI